MRLLANDDKLILVVSPQAVEQLSAVIEESLDIIG